MYSPTKVRINIESPSHFRKKKQKLNEKQTILNKKASSPTMQYGNLPFITPTARGGGDRCLHNHTSAI